MMEMTQILNSMEDAMKLQIQAKAERRAAKAQQEEQEFQEKLKRIAASKAELDGMSSKIKSTENAIQRDQLMAFMMAGF